jgi:hypothetical protein
MMRRSMSIAEITGINASSADTATATQGSS